MALATPYAGLDTFLTALRHEGIPVGPHELVRLQHVFSLSPSLQRAEIKALLACTLVKHAAERERFDALCSYNHRK